MAEAKTLTAADAAKLVKRPVLALDKDKKPVLKDGKPQMRDSAVRADEVLSFKDYGDSVVVVTKDGQKFRGEK